MSNIFIKFIAPLTAFLALISCKDAINGYPAVQEESHFCNPVIKENFADPTMLDDRARSGYFYAYSTQSTVTLPIYRSKDMVNWEYVCDGFAGCPPNWCPKGKLWAPDINYIDGKYVLYYAMGVWGGLKESASGVAVSDSPLGPFVDKGMIVSYSNTGVLNCIDPVFWDDGVKGSKDSKVSAAKGEKRKAGKKYLLWGSFCKGSGIWIAELADDGLSIRPESKLVQLTAIDTEGAYLCKRKGWYYLFASRGTCCEEERSTYHVVVGRSRKLLGPYRSPDGKNMLDHDYSYTILKNSADKNFIGPGHNAGLITDDAGQDWMGYHSWWEGNDYSRRCFMLDRIIWRKGWPRIKGIEPSSLSPIPFVKN